MPQRRRSFLSATQGATVLALLLGSCAPSYDPLPIDTYRMAAAPSSADIVFSSNLYDPRPESHDDLFALDVETGTIARLTFCNTANTVCAMIEACPSFDRQRVAVRRVLLDVDGDGLLTSRDGAGLFFLDLSRSVQSELAPQSARVSGADWSPAAALVAYSAAQEGSREDIYRRDVGSDAQAVNVTVSSAIGERRPRFHASGGLVVYERDDDNGRGTIWELSSATQQRQLTEGGPEGGRLTESGTLVGTDSDPCYSPDSTSVAFRRLDAAGGRLGEWSVRIVTILPQGLGTLTTIESGPQFRGAPDWADRGIVFVRTDETAGSTELVLWTEGTGATTLLALQEPARIAHPRWLR